MQIVLNLVPPSVLERRERAARRRALVGVPLLAAAVIALVYALLAYQAAQVRAGARETEALLVPLRPAAVRLSQLQAETEELEGRRQRLRAAFGAPGTLSVLLEDISRLIPTTAWLQSLAVEGRTVTLTGSTTDLSAVALFATTLTRSRVVAAVEMRSIQQAAVGDRMVTQFQLVARIR